MKKFKSHKTVEAFKIAAIAPYKLTGGAQLQGALDETVDVAQKYMDKHQPQVGGYYVVYADDYESFSPAKAFEEGYTEIVDEKPTTTRGIKSAQTGALSVLQHATRHQDNVFGSHTFQEITDAALEVSVYHAPEGDQAARHMTLSNALAAFLQAIVENTDPGPERSTAISQARMAKFFASAAIALEGR